MLQPPCSTVLDIYRYDTGIYHFLINLRVVLVWYMQSGICYFEISAMINKHIPRSHDRIGRTATRPGPSPSPSTVPSIPIPITVTIPITIPITILITIATTSAISTFYHCCSAFIASRHHHQRRPIHFPRSLVGAITLLLRRPEGICIDDAGYDVV